jgi:hypothetical protein
MSADTNAAGDGERCKREGMARSAVGNRTKIVGLQLGFLAALRRAPTRTATIDDATTSEEIAVRFGDGDKWRGPSLRELALDNLILPVRPPVPAGEADRRLVRLSIGPSRHQIAALRQQLAEREKQPVQGRLSD